MLNTFILSNPAVPVWSAPKHATLQGRGMEGVSPLHYSSLLSLAGGTQSLRNHIGPGLAEGSNHFTRRTGGQSSCGGYLQACKLLQGTSIGIPASFNVLLPSREPSLQERFPCWQRNLSPGRTSSHPGTTPARKLQRLSHCSSERKGLPLSGFPSQSVSDSHVSLPQVISLQGVKRWGSPCAQFSRKWRVNQKQKLLQMVVQI